MTTRVRPACQAWNETHADSSSRLFTWERSGKKQKMEPPTGSRNPGGSKAGPGYGTITPSGTNPRRLSGTDLRLPGPDSDRTFCETTYETPAIAMSSISVACPHRGCDVGLIRSPLPGTRGGAIADRTRCPSGAPHLDPQRKWTVIESRRRGSQESIDPLDIARVFLQRYR